MIELLTAIPALLIALAVPILLVSILVVLLKIFKEIRQDDSAQ